MEIEIANWSFWRSDRQIIKNLSLRIRSSERVLMTGPSGCGKSTILMAVAGLINSQSRILIDGRLPTWRQVGFVMQDPDSQIIFSNTGDEVAFPLESVMSTRSQIWKAVNENLRSVGLEAEALTDILSYGQKQRLAIACALARAPKILLLDEILASLDDKSTELVLHYFDTLHSNCKSPLFAGPTTLITSHDPEPWIDRVDRVIVLNHDGSIKYNLSAGEVKNTKNYLGKSKVFFEKAGNQSRLSKQIAKSVVMRVSNLTLARQNSVLFENLNFQIHAGECVGLTGPNGIGKSSLLLALAGAIRPKHGYIVFTCCVPDKRFKKSIHSIIRKITAQFTGTAPRRPSKSPGKIASEKITAARWHKLQNILKKHTAIVMQNPEHQFLTSRVETEVAGISKPSCSLSYPSRDSGISRNKSDDMLVKLNLFHVRSLSPFTLSWGQKQRLAIACALARAPKILLLDEPFAGQDAQITEKIVDLLNHMRQRGVAIVIAAHNKQLLNAFCNRVVELRPTGIIQ